MGRPNQLRCQELTNGSLVGRRWGGLRRPHSDQRELLTSSVTPRRVSAFEESRQKQVLERQTGQIRPTQRLCALTLTLFGALQLSLQIQAPGQVPVQDPAQQFRTKLSAKVQLLEQQNAAAVAGSDGWLYLRAELRFLSVGRFWAAAAAVSRSPKSGLADPLPAILDFNKQLKERGIQLLVVPIPPKAAIYPEEILPELAISGKETMTTLNRFYDELRANGVEVLDLAPRYFEFRAKEHDLLFCKTDSHWSGLGCMLAAQAIAQAVRAKIATQPSGSHYVSDWVSISLDGDLGGLLGPDTPKTAPERISVRSVTDKATGKNVEPDSNSSVLLLGDSFTLVFHDFYAANAGLIDQLALELGFAPDLIGTRGSGATPVRAGLYRRASKDPGYLAKKKIIIWCFASREFTEAAQGWQELPVAK
jgi:hypothetical protein